MNFRVAMQLAVSRELLNWFGSFLVVAAAGLITGFRRSAKPCVLVPFLPLTFVLGYQVDLAYGSKLNRIRGEKQAKLSISFAAFELTVLIYSGEAENIIKFESELLELPMYLPTLSSIDQGRQAQHDRLQMHSAEPPAYY